MLLLIRILALVVLDIRTTNDVSHPFRWSECAEQQRRLYWPKERDPSIINGSWRIPPVKEVK